MKRKLIYNDPDRLKLIENLIAHREMTGPDGQAIFDESIRTRMIDLHRRMQALAEQHKRMVSEQRDLRSLHQTQTRILVQTVRATWNLIGTRVKTGALPNAYLGLFALTADGKRPHQGDARDWIAYGRQVVIADGELEANGYPPLGEPNRETIQSRLEEVQRLTIAYETNLDVTKATARELASLRIEAKRLIREITYRIQIVYLDQPKQQQRNMMRILGFSFEGETRDQGEPITEPTG